MISVVIVEDEVADRDALAACLERYGKETGEEFNIVYFPDAVSLLDNYGAVYDIIFMDIVLPKLNGMAAAKKLREIDKNVTLIFVTNMVNFAVRGYEVNALDFIVKPIVYDSFLMKMDKAVEAVRSKTGAHAVIHTEGSLKIVYAADIRYIEVMRNSVVYHTTGGDYKMRGSMKDAESIFSGDDFVRCNVCYLVNLRFVREVNGDEVNVGGDVLHISRAKRRHFLEKLTDYWGRRA